MGSMDGGLHSYLVVFGRSNIMEKYNENPEPPQGDPILTDQ